MKATVHGWMNESKIYSSKKSQCKARNFKRIKNSPIVISSLLNTRSLEQDVSKIPRVRNNFHCC
jgi:hypothetical protein